MSPDRPKPCLIKTGWNSRRFSNSSFTDINATCNKLNSSTELQFIQGNQSIEMISLGPNLWISHDWAGAQPWAPTHRRAMPSRSELVFSNKRALLQTEVVLSFISCLDGWSQTIPQVKKPDVEFLGVLPNSLKRCWRQIIVEKRTFNYLATTLVDIPAVSMWHCDKTAHFRVAFYCPQHNVHLCNDHAA